ncbi:MAG: hypothetical protein AAF281_15010, partial [Pseudomonadota bacterium]
MTPLPPLIALWHLGDEGAVYHSRSRNCSVADRPRPPAPRNRTSIPVHPGATGLPRVDGVLTAHAEMTGLAVLIARSMSPEEARAVDWVVAPLGIRTFLAIASRYPQRVRGRRDRFALEAATRGAKAVRPRPGTAPRGAMAPQGFGL